MANDENLVRHEALLMIIVVDHTDLGAALATPGVSNVGEPLEMLLEWTRQGSPVVVARMSRETNFMLLPGVKVSTLVGVDELAIEVKKVGLESSWSPT